jgi:hypothetical protein
VCKGCDEMWTWISSEFEESSAKPELNSRAYCAALCYGGTYEQLRAFYADKSF